MQLKRYIRLFIIHISMTMLWLPNSTATSLQKPPKKIRISLIRKLLDNFHTVQKNALYRSRQLSARRLKKYIIKHNIKTIINLRGVNKGSAWWHKEKNVAHDLHVRFYNISMTASKLSSRENLIKLLKIYKNAPLPILIHCKSGVDRTGEAAALWVLEQQKKHKKLALNQLSLKYGYIRSLRPEKQLLIKLWQDYNWLLTAYNATDYQTT